MKIFSGSSSFKLAEDVCSILGVPLSHFNLNRYSNGCFEMMGEEEIGENKVFLFQTSLPDSGALHMHIWELLQMASLLKTNGAKEIIAVMPYVSYARSDKKYADKMAVCGELLANLLEKSGITAFAGVDFHSNKFESFFSVKAYNIPAAPLFENYFKDRNLENAFFLPADGGILEKGKLLAQKLGIPCGEVKKERLSDKEVRFKEITGNFEGKDVIIFDDEISTGTTLKTLSEEVLARKAKSLEFAVTHGLFTGKAIENFKGLNKLKEIVITDTIPLRQEAMDALPIKIIPVANLLAQKIKEI